MTDRIVVGLDGSDHARRALEYGIAEVRRRDDAVLVGLHAYLLPIVYGPGAGMPPQSVGLEQTAWSELDTWLEEVPDDIAVETDVVGGSAARALVAASDGADLVIVGSRGRGGFQRLLLGSTSQQVVAHAHCPVVVIPDESSGGLPDDAA